MVRRHKHPSGTSLKRLFIVSCAVCAVVAGLILYFAQSASVLDRDRLSVVVYGKNTGYYSFGLKDAGTYVLPFYPDLKITVPGGYGPYRIGGIGKLAQLEKKPDIFRRSFSAATSSFVDFYFYKPDAQVYFGSDEIHPVYPSVLDFFTYSSNASLPERFAIAFEFLRTQPNQYKALQTVEKDVSGQRYLLSDSMSEMYQGFFYLKAYSSERKDVQILYSKSYESAMMISKILQGTGIRVSDISEDTTKPGHCTVVEQKKPFSKTAVAIADYLSCEIIEGKTDIYDILVHLANKEREW